MLCRLCRDTVHHGLRRCARFAKEGIHIRMPGSNPNRSIGGPTKIDGYMGLLGGADFREGFLDRVIASLKVERLISCPHPAQDIQIFFCPDIALVMTEPVTITLLLSIGCPPK